MNCELIVAMSKNGVIGNNNKLPWNIPEDLAHFSNLTKGAILIMGRKTFESLPEGGLKNRLNVVLSRTPYNNNIFDKNIIFTTLSSLYTVIQLHQVENQKIFIIGGSEIYNIFMEHCNKLHITIIDEIIEGDSYFPYNNKYLKQNYKLISKSEILHSKKENRNYQYLTYTKI
jgi:dihydrofolate reductase